MKKSFAYGLLAAGLMISCSASVLNIKHAPAPKKAASQTTLGLYVTAKEAAKYLDEHKEGLLIDVRSPSEIHFIGSAPRTDIYVPYKYIDTAKLKSGNYKPIVNIHFVEEIEFELHKKGVTKTTPIFVMCRSGSSRSAPVVNELAKKGYKVVYTLTDGFQGGKRKTGPQKSLRTKDGWQNSGLDWSWKYPKEKVWYPCKYKKVFDATDRAACEKKD